MFRDKDKPMASKVLMGGSFFCILFALFGSLGRDIYLASTQWLLVGVAMGVWGVYLLLEAEFRS